MTDLADQAFEAFRDYESGVLSPESLALIRDAIGDEAGRGWKTAVDCTLEDLGLRADWRGERIVAVTVSSGALRRQRLASS